MDGLVGQTLLNRYRIDAFLGRGGMAEVYKVWDSQRSVYLAMKVLREDLAEDQVFLRRFEREAQTLARLQHPNIVRLYGLERDGHLAFMLMDFVDGTTLRREILEAKGPLPLQRVLEILRPVCAALHYAHSQGLVHCDVKPGNIMIDRGGRVLLTDFGIARVAEGATATMVGLGTPAYMAPELVRGHDPSPQTDIYALGVVLYEMLTGGERPFTGEKATITGTTSEKVRWEQLNLPPADVRSRNPHVPPEVEATILWCLAKEPSARPATVNQLLVNLERTTSAIPVTLPATREPQAARTSAEVLLEASLQPDAPAVEPTPMPNQAEVFSAIPLHEQPQVRPSEEQPAPARADSSLFRWDEKLKKRAWLVVRHAVLWLIASILGLSFADAVLPYVVEELEYYSLALHFGFVGFVLGLAQWLVLQGKSPGAGWWPFATSAGWALMAWLSQVHFASEEMAATFAGLALGFVQWFLVWRNLPGTAWWLVVVAVGTLIGWSSPSYLWPNVPAALASGYLVAKHSSST